MQSGEVSLVYTLKDPSVTSSDVVVSYSTNGGKSFRVATAAAGGEGSSGLRVSESGESHVFVWDSSSDLGDGRYSEVLLRVAPDGGTSGVTRAFSIHNTVFLVAARDRSSGGELGLYELDLDDGALRSRSSVAAGGDEPRAILQHDGTFYVANGGSGSISAFRLDEDARELVSVEGSPFSTGGIGPTWLAADSGRLWASHREGGTIAIFDIDSATGALSQNPHTGASVSGARGIVVRGGQLYIAREAPAGIVVLDIAGDGELSTSTFSPVTTGGAGSPRALTRFGSRLYAADFTGTGLAGWDFLGGGELTPLGGSPFSLTNAGPVAFARHGSRFYLAGGAATSVTIVDLAADGTASENAGSPLSVSGTVEAVAVAGDLLLAGTSTPDGILVFSIEENGTLAEASGSPHSSPAAVTALAVSE